MNPKCEIIKINKKKNTGFYISIKKMEKNKIQNSIYKKLLEIF